MTNRLIRIIILAMLPALPCAAVQTVYVTMETEEHFKAGEPNGVLISSEGELSLGYRFEKVFADSNDVWVVNALAEGADGSLYVATSGGGYVYRLRDGQDQEIIYGLSEADAKHVFSLAIDNGGQVLIGTGGQSGEILQLDVDGQWQRLFEDEEVKYIWQIVVADDDTMYFATGPVGRVYSMCLASSAGQAELLYESQEKNILSLALGSEGILFAGSGENGLIYRIDPVNEATRVLYDTGHSEVSSLIFDGAGNLYASTADVGSARPGAKLILSDGVSGRTEVSVEKKKLRAKRTGVDNETDTTDKQDADRAVVANADATDDKVDVTDGGSSNDGDNDIDDDTHDDGDDDTHDGIEGNEQNSAEVNDEANGAEIDSEVKAVSVKDTTSKRSKAPATLDAVVSKPPKSKVSGNGVGGGGFGGVSSPAGSGGGAENEVFKISPSGLVRSVFKNSVVILDMAFTADGDLLLGTGNDGKVLRLDVAAKEAVELHSADPSGQVSALLVGVNGKVYCGCANPGGVLVIGSEYHQSAEYVSEVIDASQVSLWGKMHIEIEKPSGTSVTVATRSGNTSEPQKGGWEDWSQAQDAGEDVAVSSAAGRFLQYRLTLGSDDGLVSPMVELVKLAHMIPNLPPRLTGVAVSRGGGKGNGGNNSGGNVLTVKWVADDENKDKLIYDVYVRAVGNSAWVQIGDDLDDATLAWETTTVADGRYEVKVEASDSPSNAPGKELSDSRLSRPVVVDNTPPDVDAFTISQTDNGVHVHVEVNDALSAIGSVNYSVNSAEEWVVAAAVDGVFDSRCEVAEFDVELDGPGAYLLAVRVEDASGNAVYVHEEREVLE